MKTRDPEERTASVSRYLKSFAQDSLARMSGPLSVPFAFLMLYVSNHTQRVLFGALAIASACTASYRVWRQQVLAGLEHEGVLRDRIAQTESENAKLASIIAARSNAVATKRDQILQNLISELEDDLHTAMRPTSGLPGNQVYVAPSSKCWDTARHESIELGEEVAVQRVRAIWKLPPGPIQNLTRAIEDAGGIIFRCDFGTRDVDAISQLLPGGTPLFLVNAIIPADRLRFTLAHEVGHIVMHGIPNDQMEKEAEIFAAELLMPAAEIRRDLIDVSLSKLATLKSHWRVSMNALLKRAGDLRTITERKKQSLWTQMGKLGFRKHEPIDIPFEEPTLVNEMIATYSTDLGYNLSEISEVLHESEERIRDSFLPKKFKLRLVNVG